MFSYILTASGVISIFANNKNYTIPPDHTNYEKIKEAIRNGDYQAIDTLADVCTSVKNYTQNDVEIRDGNLYYKNELINPKIGAKIIRLIEEKLPYVHMLRFLENLMQNPSRRAVNQLLDFLEHKALPITDDGCFYAYKRVKDSWMDFYSGKFDNSIGNTVSMPRNECDDEHLNACSHGLHVGSIEYVRGFHSGGHVVIVKVNPKDVVAVPTDHNCQKCRVCSYVVYAEYTADLGESSVYDSKLQPIYKATEEDCEDQEYEDDIEDDCEDQEYEDDIEDDDIEEEFEEEIAELEKENTELFDELQVLRNKLKSYEINNNNGLPFGCKPQNI